MQYLLFNAKIVTGGKEGKGCGVDGATLANLNESQTNEKMQEECQGWEGGS